MLELAVDSLECEKGRAGQELECVSIKDALGMPCSSGEIHASRVLCFLCIHLCIKINKVQTAASVVTRNSAETFQQTV